MRFDFAIPVLYSDEDIAFFDGLARKLESRGKSVALLAASRRGYERLRLRHPSVFYVYEGFTSGQNADPQVVAALERRYRLGSMQDHVYPEHRYWGRPIEALVARAVFVFGWVERFLAKHTIRLFLNDIGGEILRSCLARAADVGGPPVVTIEPATFHGRIALTTQDGSWDELPVEPPPIDDVERATIQKVVDDAITARKMFAVFPPLGIRARNVLRYVSFLKETLSGDQVDYSLRHMTWERIQRLARRTMNLGGYAHPVRGEPYVFFPLHMAIDSAITIRAPQFQNQEFLVEYLAERALPSGFKLYVKPHPSGLDSYPSSMLARIRRTRNVRLIEPRLNSHELIKAAECVVVINSTAGFESLLYCKPVVALGRVFYRGHGVTRDVDNLFDLRQAVPAAVGNPPDRERVLRFLHSVYKLTYPGRFPASDDENLENVTRAVLDKAARLASREAQAVSAASGS